jgi:hypothetical protein
MGMQTGILHWGQGILHWGQAFDSAILNPHAVDDDQLMWGIGESKD